MSDPVYINRDPFARMDLMRLAMTPGHGQSCKWCGMPARFLYVHVQDGVNRPPDFSHAKPMCSVGCYRTY